MIWVNDLVNKLVGSGKVQSYRVWPDRLAVRYTNSTIERYWLLPTEPPTRYIRLNRSDAVLKSVPPVLSVFEPDLFTGEQPYRYYSIPQKAYEAATQIERTLALLELTDRTVATGYQGRLPARFLERDMERALAYDIDQQERAGDIVFRAKSFRRCGDIIAHHFMSLGRDDPPTGRFPYGSKLCSPRFVYRAFRRLERTGCKLTSRNLMALLSADYRTGPHVYFFGGYAALFRRLGVAGSVLDLHPDTGAKALACARLGLRYLTLHDRYFDAALHDGYEGVTRLDHDWLRDGERADWVVSDSNMSGDAQTNFGAAAPYLGRASRLIVHGTAATKGGLEPEAAVRTTTFPYGQGRRGVESFFYIW